MRQSYYQLLIIALVNLATASGHADDLRIIHNKVVALKNEEEPSCLEVSPSGKGIVVVNNSADIGFLIDVEGTQRMSKTTVAHARYAVFANDGKHLWVGGSDGQLSLLECESLRVVQTLPVCKEPIDRLQVAGKLLIVYTRANAAIVYAADGTKIQHLLTLKNIIGTTPPVRASGSVHWLTSEGVLHTFDPATKELTAKPVLVDNTKADITTYTLSPDGKFSLLFDRKGLLTRRPLQRDPTGSELLGEAFALAQALTLVGDKGLLVAQPKHLLYKDWRTERKLVTLQYEDWDARIRFLRPLAKWGSFAAARSDGTILIFTAPLLE